jgi:hypothetical protein
MRCPECVAAGWRSCVYDNGGGVRTLMTVQRFWDEDGVLHVHDPNATTARYRCSRGHEWTQEHKTPCPAAGCDYNEATT